MCRRRRSALGGAATTRAMDRRSGPHEPCRARRAAHALATRPATRGSGHLHGRGGARHGPARRRARPDCDAARKARDGARPAEALSIDDDALARELEAELATSADSVRWPPDPARGSMRREDGTDAATSAAAAWRVERGGSRSPRGTKEPRRPVKRAGWRRAPMDRRPAADADVPADDGVGRASAARAPGSGREAGTTRDDLAATEGSPVLPGALTVQRRDMIRPGDEAARQADMAQAGIYAGEPQRSRAVAPSPRRRPPQPARRRRDAKPRCRRPRRPTWPRGPRP